MSKNLIPILTLFLIALVTFVVLQIVGVLTQNPLPTATQKQIQKIDPTLNTKVLNDLKQSPQFN